MGPSGSGKTSLLNVLSKRQGLSGGSYYSGNIMINGKELTSRSEFSKHATFVQQEDVLPGLMTPRELFAFAAQLGTNLTRD
jgi:ABC-type multidrug transport system ATPase subunit